MQTQSALPKYDPLQHVFHEAFDQELTEVVDHLRMAPDSRIVDVPCGDGFYSRRMARRLMAGGQVVGIDNDEAYLARARSRTNGEAVSFQRGDAYALPCDDASFDQALCAMSFISIEDPAQALREIWRVLTPGGGVAVLESDEYHHVLFTWPVDLEVAIQRALRDGTGGRRSPARQVNRMLREAGFEPPRKKTFTADRQAPFSTTVREFLTLHLAYLRDLVRPHLASVELARFDHYADPGQRESLFTRADAEVTCLLTLYQARRPA